MSKIKYMVESIIEMIDSRLTDIKLIHSKRPGQNIVTTVYEISSKENGRLRQIIKYQININELVREESNQSISEIGKYLYGVSANIFSKINKNFRPDKQTKADYNGLITLFRKYFIQDNDIRMVTKLEELFRNKSIKKPVILIKLLKILIDITRAHLLEIINNVNQCITQNDVEEYNHQKRQVFQEIFPINMTNSFESIIRKNTLRVVCPIFMIQSVSRFHQQVTKPIINDKRLDSLLARRNKLRQKWRQRISNKQLQQKPLKPSTSNTSQPLRKRHFNSVPVSININNIKQTSECQFNTEENISFFQSKKPKTTQIIRRSKEVKQKLFQQRELKTPIGIKKQEKFRDFSGISTFKSIYGILGIDQKANNKMFLKKTRKYFLELQLKDSIGRNKDISKQIGFFNRLI